MQWYNEMVTKLTDPWFAVGMVGESLFFLRFVVQWIASERKKRPVIPVAFWYLSLIGTVIILAYSIYRAEPLFILAFSLNIVIYLRNLHFVRIRKAKAKDLRSEKTDGPLRGGCKD